MKDIDEAGYTYLGIFETDKIKEKEMKKTFSKEYLRWLRLILRSKLNGRNRIMAVNTWAVSMMRFDAVILRKRKRTMEKQKNVCTVCNRNAKNNG